MAVVQPGAEVRGPTRVDQHDVVGLQCRRAGVELVHPDQAVGLDPVGRPDDTLAVEPVERDVVDARAVDDEVAGGVDVGADVDRHLHLGEVQGIAGQAQEPLETGLGEVGDPRHPGREDPRQLDPLVGRRAGGSTGPSLPTGAHARGLPAGSVDSARASRAGYSAPPWGRSGAFGPITDMRSNAMKRTAFLRLALGITAVVVTATAVIHAPAGAKPQQPSQPGGEFVVAFADGDEGAARAAIRRAGGTIVDVNEAANLALVSASGTAVRKICAPCRTTSATAIPSTPLITPGLPGAGSRGCGSRLRTQPLPRPHDASARALLRLVGAAFSGFPLSVLRSRNWHSAPANELVKPGQGYLQVFQKRQGGNLPFQDWR